MSKKIPQSVVAFTIASSTISPSLIFFNASVISAFLLFSRTALLETQTFPLFLSILVAITLTEYSLNDQFFLRVLHQFVMKA